MQRNVKKVVGKRPRAPQFVFDPKNRVKKRIVLRRRCGIRPNPTEPVQRTQLGGSDMNVIVPDWFTIPSRLISDRGRNDQD